MDATRSEGLTHRELNDVSCEEVLDLLRNMGASDDDLARIQRMRIDGRDLSYLDASGSLSSELGMTLPSFKLSRLYDDIQVWKVTGVPTSLLSPLPSVVAMFGRRGASEVTDSKVDGQASRISTHSNKMHYHPGVWSRNYGIMMYSCCNVADQKNAGCKCAETARHHPGRYVDRKMHKHGYRRDMRVDKGGWTCCSDVDKHSDGCIDGLHPQRIEPT
jgi:hypothetical protein